MPFKFLTYKTKLAVRRFYREHSMGDTIKKFGVSQSFIYNIYKKPLVENNIHSSEDIKLKTTPPGSESQGRS